MMSLDSATFDNMKSPVGAEKDTIFSSRCVPDDNLKNSCEGRHSNTKPVTKKLDRTSCSTKPLSQGNCDELLNFSKGTNSVRLVNGVAVVHGRTRCLVERFEKEEVLNDNEKNMPDRACCAMAKPVQTSSLENHDVLLSTFRSWLTKLQVVQHFLGPK